MFDCVVDVDKVLSIFDSIDAFRADIVTYVTSNTLSCARGQPKSNHNNGTGSH